MRIQPENIAVNANQDQIKRSIDYNASNNNINFNAFQSSIINLNNVDSSKKNNNQFIDKKVQEIGNQNMSEPQQLQSQNRIFKKKESMRQRLYSDATALTCWLCNELQKPSDPFIHNCKCTGSNHIHAMCLVKLVEEELKSKKKIPPPNFKWKNINQHQCSICKYKFQSELTYKFNFNFSISLKNIWLVIIGFLSLLFSVAMMVITYLVFIQQSNGEGSLQDIYIGFVIFLGVLCVIIFLSFLFLAFFLLYKAFVKLIPQYIKLISDIKDKVIISSFDPIKSSYFYNPQLNIYPSKCQVINTPQNYQSHQKSPQQCYIKSEGNQNGISNLQDERKSPSQIAIINQEQMQIKQNVPVDIEQNQQIINKEIQQQQQQQEHENLNDDFNILRTFG